MKFLIGFIVGILVADVGVMRIAQALQSVVDFIKSFL